MVESSGAGAGPGRQLWAYIISWTGRGDNAREIAEQIAQHVDRLVVVYSNDKEEVESGVGEWKQLPNSDYYGRKFDLALRDFSGDIMLHIQADVSCDDWPNLIASCRQALATHPNLGIWTPNIEHCFFNLDRTLLRTGSDGLHEVVRTDAIVWALSSALCDLLRPLDYTKNTYGWGIDATAAVRSRTNDLSIVLDPSTLVIHPYGSGYDTRAAAWSMHDFVYQLSAHERRVLKVLDRYVQLRVLLEADSARLAKDLALSLQTIKRPLIPIVRRVRRRLGAAPPPTPSSSSP